MQMTSILQYRWSLCEFNALHGDSVCTDALFPAETADVLGRPGRFIQQGSGDRYVFDATDASAHADRGQVLAANTTITRSVIAVGNNTNNRTVFWSPTGRTAPKFDANAKLDCFTVGTISEKWSKREFARN